MDESESMSVVDSKRSESESGVRAPCIFYLRDCAGFRKKKFSAAIHPGSQRTHGVEVQTLWVRSENVDARHRHAVVTKAPLVVRIAGAEVDHLHAFIAAAL